MSKPIVRTLQTELINKMGATGKDKSSYLIDDSKGEMQERIAEVNKMRRRTTRMNQQPKNSEAAAKRAKKELTTSQILNLLYQGKFTFDEIYEKLYGTGTRIQSKVKYLQNMLQEVRIRTDEIVRTVKQKDKDGKLIRYWGTHNYEGTLDALKDKFKRTKRKFKRSPEAEDRRAAKQKEKSKEKEIVIPNLVVKGKHGAEINIKAEGFEITIKITRE